MNRIGRAKGESLVLEDGKVSAQALPLDASAAAKNYQTASFGMG